MENKAILYVGIAVAAVAAVAFIAYFAFSGKREKKEETIEEKVKEELLELWAKERQVNVLVMDTDVRAISEKVDLWDSDKTEILTNETTDDDGIAHFDLVPYCTEPVITTEFIRGEITGERTEWGYKEIVEYFLAMDIWDTGDIFHFKLQDFTDDQDWIWSSDYLQWTEAIGNGNRYDDFDFTGMILIMTFEAPLFEMSETGVVELDFNITRCTDDTQEFLFEVWRGDKKMGGGMTVNKHGTLIFDTQGAGIKGAVGSPVVHQIRATSVNAVWSGTRNFDVWQFEMEDGVILPQVIATSVPVRQEGNGNGGNGEDIPAIPTEDEERSDDGPEPPPEEPPEPDERGSIGDQFRWLMEAV